VCGLPLAVYGLLLRLLHKHVAVRACVSAYLLLQECVAALYVLCSCPARRGAHWVRVAHSWSASAIHATSIERSGTHAHAVPCTEQLVAGAPRAALVP